MLTQLAVWLGVEHAFVTSKTHEIFITYELKTNRHSHQQWLGAHAILNGEQKLKLLGMPLG